MVVGADSTAALGVSYGISSWQGEKWTAEEALQAVLMAAAFRTAMVGAEKFRLRAVRDPETGTPSIVPEPVAFTSSEVRQELNRAIRERSQAATSGAPRDVIAGYDARIAELSTSVRFSGKLRSFDKAEIAGTDFRMVFENGAVAFEKRAGNGWQKAAPDTVPENVSAKAAEMVF